MKGELGEELAFRFGPDWFGARAFALRASGLAALLPITPPAAALAVAVGGAMIAMTALTAACGAATVLSRAARAARES